MADRRYRNEYGGLTDTDASFEYFEVRDGLRSSLTRALEHLNMGDIALHVEENAMTLGMFNRLFGGNAANGAIAAPDLVGEVRRVKSVEETAILKRACEVSIAAIDRAVRRSDAVWSERRLAAEIEYEAMKLGSEGTAFATIVAAGANGAEVHHQPGKQRMQPGPLLIDFGAVIEGYGADVSRSYLLGASSKAWQRRYSVVWKAQRSAEKLVRVGVACRDVDLAARGPVEAASNCEMPHAVGHGVGFGTSPAPLISSKAADTLLAGDVVTLEPGWYTPGEGGVRIEDCFVVNATKAVRLGTPPPPDIPIHSPRK